MLYRPSPDLEDLLFTLSKCMPSLGEYNYVDCSELPNTDHLIDHHIHGKHPQKFLNRSRHVKIYFLFISNLYFMLLFFCTLLVALKSFFKLEK